MQNEPDEPEDDEEEEEEEENEEGYTTLADPPNMNDDPQD